MAPSCSLLVALLLATAALSHGAEPGAPRGKRRQAATSAGGGGGNGGNGLQHPLRGLQGHRHGGGRQAPRRAPHPLARPGDDGAGLASLSPVRLETGPARDRDGVRTSTKSLSQTRENQLLGTRKGRRHGNGHGHHFGDRRQGGRRDKERHGKGIFAEPELSSALKDGDSVEDPFSSSSSSSLSPPPPSA
ncbi:draxin [Pungitius sinensis]